MPFDCAVVQSLLYFASPAAIRNTMTQTPTASRPIAHSTYSLTPSDITSTLWRCLVNQPAKEQYLRVALVVFGVIFLLGVFPLMMLWPSGWRWIPNQSDYEQMILGVYATLGLFLLLASRAPSKHRSLIQFAAWSSLVHGGIMAVQAVRDSTQMGHLMGDVPALALVGIVLLLLMPSETGVRAAV